MDRKSGLAFGVFVLLVLVLVIYHEPWRDESDAWLMARDQSLGGILRMGGYSGTPALWYLIQAPFAKGGAAYETQRYLHALIAISAVGLLLFRAPFPFALRCVMAFGYYFSFEYAVVARNYSAGILLCFIALAMDGRRLDLAPLYGLVIGLAANTSVHFTLFAMALFVPFAWNALERRTDRGVWIGIGLALAGIGVAVWQLWPEPGGQFPAAFFDRFKLSEVRKTLAHALVPRQDRPWAVAIGISATVLTIVKLWSAPRALLVFVLSSLGLGYVFVCKYAGGLRHYGLFFVAIVIGLWIGEGPRHDGVACPPLVSRRLFTWAMVLLLLPSLTMAVRIWRVEMKYAFSEAADMARYINASHLDQARIAVHKPMSSVLPYLPRRTFWYPAMGEEGSHMRWDINWANGWRMPMDEAVRRMKEQCPDWQDPADPVLLLLSEALPDPQKDGVRLVYRTPGRAWGPSDEQFHLYAPAAFSPPSSSMRPGAPVCRHTPPRDILGHTRCPDGRIPCLK